MRYRTWKQRITLEGSLSYLKFSKVRRYSNIVKESCSICEIVNINTKILTLHALKISSKTIEKKLLITEIID